MCAFATSPDAIPRRVPVSTLNETGRSICVLDRSVKSGITARTSIPTREIATRYQARLTSAASNDETERLPIAFMCVDLRLSFYDKWRPKDNTNLLIIDN